jgi:hypothetical protein
MMTSSYWEKFVYAEAPLANLERRDASVVFEWLHEHLPVGQTKIDWTNVQGRHAHWRADDDAQLGVLAIQEVCKRIQPGSVVEHVGDGLSPVGVRFGEVDAFAVVGALLEIPEHHYFLADDRSWLVVVTTEGDLDALDRPAGEAA